MLIFRIEQSINNEYDTYDMAMVVACDEEHARCIHPMGNNTVWDPDAEVWIDADGDRKTLTASMSWVSDPHEHVTVERFGMVTGGSAKPGDVLVSSFNAG